MNAYATKRPDDLPLVARILREKRGQYIAIISFAQSKRHYHDELVYADTIKEVKAHIRKLYPTLKFKKG